MCLAFPMQIDTIDGYTASCSSRGISREINIFMFQQGELKPGDYIMVHVGYAIQKIDPGEARLALKTEDAMRSGNEGNTNA